MTDQGPIREIDVAVLPHPGTVVPGAIGFAPDGKSVTFLKSEDNTLSRVLWRAKVGKDPAPVVAARAPRGGDTDATVSREEQLRRERQRLRDTGIAQISRSDSSDVIVTTLGGDIYVLSADGAFKRITTTPSPELDPKPSGDGSRIAFVRDGELRVIPSSGGDEVTLSKGAGETVTNGLAEFIAQEELDRSSGFWWSPDASKIAYQQTDEKRIPLYSIAHQDAAEFSVETHRYPFAGAANASVKLGVVPSVGGETTWLDFADSSDDVYLARVDWDGPSSLLVQVLDRAQKSLKLVRIDVATGKRVTLLEERADTFVNLHHDLRIVPKTGDILWSSERAGFKHLELRDKAGALIRTLTKGEWPVDAVVSLDPDRREVWFAAGRESPLEAHLYRVSLDGGEIIRATNEPGTHKCVVAPGGDHFIDTYSDRNTPPITTIRDRNGKILATLDDASSDERVKRMGLPAPVLTEFKNREGTRLFGAYYRPWNVKPGEKKPVVVMVYGGPHVQTVTDSWGMTADLTAQFLASRGFAVWKADNRGSSRRGHAFESSLFHRMGELEVRDQADGVKFLGASQPEADIRHVGITGGSYGGYMTLRCLMLAPETFKAGVSIAPVTDWDGYDTAYTERYMGTPQNNPEGYKSSSVLTNAASMTGHLLVIHGMLDENVHFRHSARLGTALIAAGRPFELLPIPNERHSSRKVPERTYIAGRLADFFSRSLAD